MLTKEARRVIGAVATWLDMRARARPELGPAAIDPPALLEDAEKSALLERLLAGRSALPAPPPRRYGVPWYEVVDSVGPWWLPNDAVGDPLEPYAFAPSRFRSIPVNGERWLVLEQRSPDDFLVAWPGVPLVYRLSLHTPGGSWELSRVALEVDDG